MGIFVEWLCLLTHIYKDAVGSRNINVDVEDNNNCKRLKRKMIQRECTQVIIEPYVMSMVAIADMENHGIYVMQTHPFQMSFLLMSAAYVVF